MTVTQNQIRSGMLWKSPIGIYEPHSSNNDMERMRRRFEISDSCMQINCMSI